MDIQFVLAKVIRLGRRGQILNANSKENYAIFRYEFFFDDKELVYEYKRNQRFELSKEKLTVDGCQVFEMDFEKRELSHNDEELSKLDIETFQLDKYMDALTYSEFDDDGEEDNNIKHISFLRYILNNIPLPADSALIKLEDYVRRMRRIVVSSSAHSIRSDMMGMRFNDYLAEKENLEQFQDFLNTMGIECELEIKKSVDGYNEVFFKYDSLVPFFDYASSGTQALVGIYRRILAMESKPSLLYMDEFDAFYNYEMSEKIVEYLKSNYPNSQIVLTTHNTNLMNNQLMRPDCYFILSRDGRLTALCDATERELREGHNLGKLYMGGEFEKFE